MNQKKRLLGLSVVSLLSMVAMASCGGGGGGGSTTTKGMWDASFKDDLVVDEAGNPDYDEVVNLKMWSIIGDPDLVVHRQLVNKFNNEFAGRIHIELVSQGHYDYYPALDMTWATEKDNFPDVCFMHNEKTAEYAYKKYLQPLDELYAHEKLQGSDVQLDFSQIYSNIDRVTKVHNDKENKDYRFAIPVDAHGFVTQFRRDIYKKNGLGFDDNTRFIPNSKAEYQQLLERIRAKIDSEEGLLIRSINKGDDHTWKKADPTKTFPSYNQSTDPYGLGCLYANGGSMLSADQKTVTFHQNKGFETYVTDFVNRYNAKLMGGEPRVGTNQAAFGQGLITQFDEGPWWIAQTFTLNWNNSELKKAGQLGVSEEDAADPDINTPYICAHPNTWWTLDENIGTELGDKWYGNGHIVAVTKTCTSLKKIAAALTFAKWYTQGKDELTDKLNLPTWCTAGHIPAWKNVYDSDDYAAVKANSITLQALGNPADIIAMESLKYESTVISAFTSAITGPISQIESTAGCTVEQAKTLIKQAANSLQTYLDMADSF